MQIIIHPKDCSIFTSTLLDRTGKIKTTYHLDQICYFQHVVYVMVQQLGLNSSNFPLRGHGKGFTSFDCNHTGKKPYLVSGADD